MVWIKRNLFLVLFIVGALAMTGLAVFYLINRIAADKKATADLGAATTEWKGLAGHSPALTDENIAAASGEAERLKQVSTQVAPLLVTTPESPLQPVEYKTLLENTINELTKRAETLGIDLRPRYSFTFTAQRAMVEFPTNSIPPLTTQLKEVKEICRILFDSKVHSLDTLKRVKAYPTEEAAGAEDYLRDKIVVTNAVGAVITPYQVAFKGFSSELTSVLEGFQTSPVFFVVKTVESRQLDKNLGGMAPATGEDAMMEAERAGTGATAPPAGSIPGSAATPPAGATPAGGAGLKTVLDETPKRFILSLEVVKTYAN